MSLEKRHRRTRKGPTDWNASRTAVGAAFGTSKAGIGITGLGTFKPELIMKVRHSVVHPEASLPDLILFEVTHPCGHVWYHRCLWTGG